MRLNMQVLRELLNKYFRPFVAKYILRVLLYGAGALGNAIGYMAPDEATMEKVASHLAGIGCLALAAIIDRIHHRKDRAEGAKAQADAPAASTGAQ